MYNAKKDERPKWEKVYTFIFGRGPNGYVSRPRRWWYILLILLAGGAPYGIYLAVFKDRVAWPTLSLIAWAILSVAGQSLIGTALAFGAGTAYLFAILLGMRIRQTGVELIPFTVIFAAIFYGAWRYLWTW